MERMTHGPRRTAPTGAWLAVLFLLLGGLFGMHGLGGHGVSGAMAHVGATEGAGAPPRLTHDPSGGSNGQRLNHGAPVSNGAAAATAPGGEPQVSEMEAPISAAMAGLCVVVLAAAVLLLAAAARTGVASGLVLRLLRLPVLFVGRGRDRDPPSLSVLCVWRC